MQAPREVSTYSAGTPELKRDAIATSSAILTPRNSTVSPPRFSGPAHVPKKYPFIGSILQQSSQPTSKLSLLQVRPMLGLLALGFSIACMLVSMAVLLVSHNQPIRYWAIQPTVYLAIASAITNGAFGFARYQAVPIAWWYSLSRGNTIGTLERKWEVGHSLVLALHHNVHMGFEGFTTILVALMIIDGPLLQRATKVGVAAQTTDIALALKLSPELPNGFSGYGVDDELYTSPAAEQLSVEWKNRSPITLDAQPCNGTCAATVLAPGVTKTNCRSQTWPITNEMTYNPNATWGTWRGYDPSRDVFSNPMFLVRLTHQDLWRYQRSEVANLKIGLLNWLLLDNGSYSGRYVETACYYVPAILEYDLIISGTEITIPKDPDQGRIVAVAKNTLSYSLDLPLDQIQPTNMDALTFYLSVFVNANASVSMHPQSPPNAFWVQDPTSAS